MNIFLELNGNISNSEYFVIAFDDPHLSVTLDEASAKLLNIM